MAWRPATSRESYEPDSRGADLPELAIYTGAMHLANAGKNSATDGVAARR